MFGNAAAKLFMVAGDKVDLMLIYIENIVFVILLETNFAEY